VAADAVAVEKVRHDTLLHLGTVHPVPLAAHFDIRNIARTYRIVLATKEMRPGLSALATGIGGRNQHARREERGRTGYRESRPPQDGVLPSPFAELHGSS
jgi:hypothetical protein